MFSNTSSLARKAAAAAISSGVPNLAIGWRARNAWKAASGSSKALMRCLIIKLKLKAALCDHVYVMLSFANPTRSK